MKSAFSILLTLSCILIGCQEADQLKEDKLYPVKRIVDGDTFYVDDGTKKGKSIRFIGVDAPETKHPRKPVAYFGKEASAYLTKLLKGKEVRLEFDVEKYDRYNRVLAYVYLKDSTFVNAELVKNGYAQIATFPPNVKYVDLFKELQKEARENNRGLWNTDTINNEEKPHAANSG